MYEDIQEMLVPVAIKEMTLPDQRELTYWRARVNRTFYLDYYLGEDYEAIELAKIIIQMNLDEKDTATEDLKPIFIWIYTIGGDAGQCDALIDVNLHDLMDFHVSHNNMATMVSVIKNLDIPYGVIETTSSGELLELEEKPNKVLQVNCGLYVFEPEALSFIKDNAFLNITDLLIRIKESGNRVGVFPIPEKSWRDMGNWTEYLKMINSMR